MSPSDLCTSDWPVQGDAASVEMAPDVKMAPHFGQRIWVKLTQRTSAGGIWHPQCGQSVANDASTFSRLIFFRAGIQGFYRRVRSELGQ